MSPLWARNSSSSAAAVSVAPLRPLLSRQTRVEKPIASMPGQSVWSVDKVVDVAARAHDAGVELVVRGLVDDAELGPAVDREADHHGELAVLRDELLGAVERIDQPEGPTIERGLAAGCHLFFRDDGDAGRELTQAGQDDGLCRMVGVGDGTLVGLVTHAEIAGIDAHDFDGRCFGDLGAGVTEGGRWGQ